MGKAFIKKFDSAEVGMRYLKEKYDELVKRMEKKFKPMLAQIGKREDLKRKDLIFEPKLDGNYKP